MAVTINSYADLQSVLDTFVASASVFPGSAPHNVFWKNLTYQDFTTGDVPGVGKEFGGPYKILEVGNPEASNIIMALSGTPGSAFDPNPLANPPNPNDGIIGQMPQPNAPYDSATPSQSDVIAALSAWIKNGCPEGTKAAAEEEAAPAGNEGGGYSGDGSKSEGESEA